MIAAMRFNPRKETLMLNTEPRARSVQRLTQVKVSVPSEIANAFKAACAASGTTMTCVISQFMDKYSGNAVVKGGYSPNLSTRRQRRAATNNIIRQLERVKINEEQYLRGCI